MIKNKILNMISIKKQAYSLSDSELAFFAEQLSLLLHSGISLLEGISILHEDLPEGQEKQLFAQLLEHLEWTGALAPSLSEAGYWADYFIKMTELGERAGTLEDVMHTLTVHYQKRSSLQKTIRDSLAYPLLLLGMLSAVLFVLITQVMPVFYQVFRQLGIEITGLTATVFSVSRVSQTIAVCLLVLVLAALLICIPLLKTEQGKKRLLVLIYHIPFVNRIRRQLSCSRFANAMSIAIHSGLDMSESFEIASALTDDSDFQSRIEAAAALLNEGTAFGDALQQTGIFTGMNARMFSIGFRIGSADTVLEQISVSCQEEADQRIQSSVGLIEPVLTVILSLLTGLILVSVMLPLLNVMSSIG